MHRSILAVLACAGLVLTAHTPGATAQTAPQWAKICQTAETDCITWIESPASNGSAGVQNVGPIRDRASAGVQIVEPKRDSSAKVLRTFVRFPEAPPSQNGTIKILLDGKPFAELPFVQCMDKACLGQRPITEDEIGTLERAKTIQVQSGAVSVELISRDLAQVRASRGVTVAEVKEAQERVAEKLKKSAERLNKKSRDPGFLDEAPATKPLEGFCAALQEVKAAAPGKFKSILGPLNYSFYAARVSIPGAGTCEIPIGPHLGYSCNTHFKTRVLAEKQMTALVQNISKCLPQIKPERSAEANSVTVTFEDRVKGEYPRSAEVSVWLNYDKFEGADDYLVSLSVVDYRTADE